MVKKYNMIDLIDPKKDIAIEVRLIMAQVFCFWSDSNGLDSQIDGFYSFSLSQLIIIFLMKKRNDNHPIATKGNHFPSNTE